MAGTQQEGNPCGAPAEAFSEGPTLNPRLQDPPADIAASADQDGDETSDYIGNSAFKDTVG